MIKCRNNIVSSDNSCNVAHYVKNYRVNRVERGIARLYTIRNPDSKNSGNPTGALSPSVRFWVSRARSLLRHDHCVHDRSIMIL